MNWILLAIVVLVVAYFLYRVLRARHVSRCQTDQRTTEHVGDAATNSNKASLQDKTPLQKVPPPHDAPSLLYADKVADKVADKTSNRKQPATEGEHDGASARTAVAHESEASATTPSASESVSTQVSVTSHSNAPTNVTTQSDNDFPRDAAGYPLHVGDADATQPDASIPARHSATNQEQLEQHTNAQSSNTQFINSDSKSMQATTAQQAANENVVAENASVSGAVAGTVGAAAGLAAAVAMRDSSAGTGTESNDATQQRGFNGTMATEVDLELGDSTVDNNDDHDELLDFGDLTADISEMLKELNLRESDSPRLEISQDEYQQLKTGEPGDVKPEKIENVAGKLRNMLD